MENPATEKENVQLVQELYADFGPGDAPAILDQLTDDVAWYGPGPPEVPHAGRYSGQDGVGGFFTNIDEFAPIEFLAKADRVVVLARCTRVWPERPPDSSGHPRSR